MIKGSINQRWKYFNRTLEHMKQKLIKIKGEIYKSILTVGNFNISQNFVKQLNKHLKFTQSIN